ncbi:hypothetical protein IEU95_04205 [Hoyosella rhizosphaerae]|nr:hypothetical protein [Hoyosella rhizosphaerae]
MQSLIVTVKALLYARLWGGKFTFVPGDNIYVATGMRGGFARGGTTIGGVFLTRRVPSSALLRHEAIHADQWARYGLTFPVRYFWEEVRNPHAKNKFEIEAGLRDGGYSQ